MQRLSAAERTREELRALMNGELGTASGRSDLVRLALRLIVAEALESEVAEALGRERYARGACEKAGYRNGYRTGKVKTAEGAVEYAAPQVREMPEPFVSGVQRRFPAARRRSRISPSSFMRAGFRPVTLRTPSPTTPAVGSCRARR